MAQITIPNKTLEPVGSWFDINTKIRITPSIKVTTNKL